MFIFFIEYILKENPYLYRRIDNKEFMYMKEENKEALKAFITFVLVVTGIISLAIFLFTLKEPSSRVCKRCVKTETQLRSHLSWSPIVGWHYEYKQEKVCIKWVTVIEK